MDFGKAFVYMFQDDDWLSKLVIGTVMVALGLVFSPILIGFIPLIIVAGYGLDVVRNVLAHRAHPLPEWNDWGGFFVRGLKLVAALFIWSLPAIVISIPMGIGTAFLDENAASQQTIGSLLVICASCLTILWGIVVALITPAITVRLAATDNFASAFDLNWIWNFTRENLGNVIIVVLLTWAAGLIAGLGSLSGVLLCLIGLIITVPLAILWELLVSSHLYGQLGAHAAAPAEAALVVAESDAADLDVTGLDN